MTFEDGENYIGTATNVSSTKQAGLYLLTCAHNVYDAVSGEPTSVIFYPGLNSDPDSEQKCMDPIDAVSWFFPSGYVGVATTRKIDCSLLSPEMLAASIQYDYAVVKLATPVPDPPSPVPTVCQATDVELKCHRAITLKRARFWTGRRSLAPPGQGRGSAVNTGEKTLDDRSNLNYSTFHELASHPQNRRCP